MRKIIEPKVDPCETDAKLSIQYKAALAITGAIQGTSEKICQELGLESLKSRRWYKRLSCMLK